MMQGVFAKLAGGKPSLEIRQQCLNIYLMIGVMKDECQYFLAEKLYPNPEEKKGGKRLSSRLTSLQGTLNEMVSQDIHVSMI